MANNYNNATEITNNIDEMYSGEGVALSSDISAAITAILGGISSAAIGDALVGVQGSSVTDVDQSLQAAIANESNPIVAVNPEVPYTLDSADANALNTQALLLGQNVSVNATFAANSPTTTFVMGGKGNSFVKFNSSQSIKADLTGGDNDTLMTGDGHDVITYKGGQNVNISTGEGDDLVTLSGDGTVNVVAGSGNGTVVIDTNLTGAATIDGGQGFDMLRMNSRPGDHEFSIVHGKFAMHSDAALTISNTQLMVWGATDGDISPFDDVTVFASNRGESLVAKLYKIALGRNSVLDGQDGITDPDGPTGGYEFWTNYIDSTGGDAVANNTADLINRFLACDEFDKLHGTQSNAEYVEDLFDSMGATGTVAGYTQADFVNMLDAGTATRYEVAGQMAMSEEAVQLLGSDGNNYVIDLYDFFNNDTIA